MKWQLQKDSSKGTSNLYYTTVVFLEDKSKSLIRKRQDLLNSLSFYSYLLMTYMKDTMLVNYNEIGTISSFIVNFISK